MILVGNQRGGAKDLALHLLKDENDHVELHEIRGFVSQSLVGALNEAYAISTGTRCRQYLFSLSLNPPVDEHVTTADFKAEIARIEQRLGLKDQPRTIVFHEKQGRRHAHVVWSRIKVEDMKAVQLSHTKRKLMAIAREIHLERGWIMPPGLVRSATRDPRSFSLSEWQQAKRIGKDPRAIMAALQDAWAISDTKMAFAHALEERGYQLTRGDRRGFVAVDVHGEVYAIPKWVGVKTKDVRTRLGDDDSLQSVADAKARIADEMQASMKRLQRELQTKARRQNRDLKWQRDALIKRQRKARHALTEALKARRWKEARARQARFRPGFKGLWDRLSGEHGRTAEQNRREAKAASNRDRQELDTLIFTQLEDRRRLVDLRIELANEFDKRRREIRHDVNAYQDMCDRSCNQPTTEHLRRKRKSLAR